MATKLRDLRAIAEANRAKLGAPSKWDELARLLAPDELAQVEELLADPSVTARMIRLALTDPAIGFNVSESTVQAWVSERRR